MQQSKSNRLVFRVDGDLLDQIDEYARVLEQQLPGVVVNRSTAIRYLILRGIHSYKRDVVPILPEESNP